LRWLEYHERGMGIVQARKPLPLAVGGSTHAGLAELLRYGVPGPDPHHGQEVEDRAVSVALQDFAQYQATLDIGEEAFEIAAAVEKNLATTGGDAELAARVQEVSQKGRSEFEQYLYEEQSAMVEGFVRAYARRRLKPLLEQFEVLEVEREGSWKLSEWQHQDSLYDIQGLHLPAPYSPWELWFMSRPDALLLERTSKQLYILSFKTAARWDRRKNEDAKRDMQGLSEGVEVEKRLARFWEQIHVTKRPFTYPGGLTPEQALIEGYIPTMGVTKYLMEQAAPPRILGIRYEYMLKGERRIDKDLSARLGLDVRAQSSPLVRAYKNQGMAAGDEQWNISWDYLKDTGESGKLYFKNWKGAPVFESITSREWIDKLDQTVEVADTPDGLQNAWSSPAQATGFLESHPLDDIFVPPIVVYRNDDDLRDWIEQVEAQECEVAEHVQKVRQAQDEGEKRHLLNIHFQMNRRACSYPVDCSMIPVCFGGAEVRQDPLGTKLYKIREANHPQEVEHAKS
jgi:hypothetical protein